MASCCGQDGLLLTQPQSRDWSWGRTERMVDGGSTAPGIVVRRPLAVYVIRRMKVAKKIVRSQPQNVKISSFQVKEDAIHA